MRAIKFRALMQVEGQNPSWVYFGTEGKPKLISNTKWISPDLQYTDLKDKNGTEIYEGDIVRMDLPQKDVFEIRWAEAGFKAIGKIAHPLGFFRSNVWEIIGNIYENEELLDVR